MPESPDVPWGDGEDDHGVAPEITEAPARAAVFFMKFLRSRSIASGRMVDLGCGKGRNAVYFAKNHFEVHAIDKKDEMLAGLDFHGIRSYCQDVTDFLLFEDAFFDLAMDIGCYEGQDESRKENYRKEIRRVLRPGGYLLISAKLAKEQLEKEFSDFEIIKCEQDGGRANLIMR